MRPEEPPETGRFDFFRARLDQIIDLDHPLARLARTTDWGFLEATFGVVYEDGPGHPPLPTRLMAGLMILKHMHDLSDEALCDRWVENPYFQYFCGATGNAQSSAVPCIQAAAPGISAKGVRASAPASISNTRQAGSSDNRFARTHPAEPAPTTT